MKQSILTFLGSDAGFGDKNNSAYLEDNNKFLLIDCGFTVFEQVKHQFDFSKFEDISIIVTHLHNDHAGSLSQFIMYLWYVYGKKSNVYSACQNISQYLEITGTPIEAYEIFSGSENLKFIQTSHVPHLDAYGFSLYEKERKIVYTGDTSVIEPYKHDLIDASEFYVDVSKNSTVHLQIDEILPQLLEINKNGTAVYLMHTDDKEYIRKKIDGTRYYISIGSWEKEQKKISFSTCLDINFFLLI